MKGLPQHYYQQELKKFTAQLTLLQNKRKQLGWMRFAVFTATVVIASRVFINFGWLGVLPAITGIGILLYLVSLDAANKSSIRNTTTLIQINEEELAALEHNFTKREDGHRFMPAEHAYAADLDIFGKASIYQWLSRCYTEQGRSLLANNLLQPLSTEKVMQRQQAVKELAQNLEWRQQWQAFSMQTKITSDTEAKIAAWMLREEQHFTAYGWKIFIPVYSAVGLGAGIATLLDLIPATIFSLLFLSYLIFSLFLSKKASKPYIHLNGIVKETGTLQSLINWLETLPAQSPHLQQLQTGIQPARSKAGAELKQLKNILDRFDLRNSMAGFIFLNTFLLWDVRQMISLNKWRNRNKTLVKEWFDAVAETEVLHSISTLHFNHPAWAFPTFIDKHFTFDGETVGHPLLAESQRVNNSFQLEGVAKINLVTGSNMAGKSTFLRSLGVNIVLAQTGAPVCAKRLQLSPVQLVSSMRITDNLAENISTFYAELKKLRTIIEMTKAKQPLFILLDEILRGTNSYDRHKGSAALIRQLIKESAVAVIATHDVELAQIENEYPQSIVNYHFDVEVEGEELYFDYKLKAGVCKSLNASILMKKIGIELPE